MDLDLPLVIVNPAAAGGAAGREWPHLAATVRTHFGPFASALTRGPLDAARLAEDEARRGRRLLIALGGDGTISEVASGILRSGTDAELAVLPHGTGADFLRTLGIPRRLADAARLLRNGASRSIDVGKISFTAHDGSPASRFFVNSASFGMSGEVAERANRSSKRWGGKLGFASATLRTAVTYQCPEISLSLDGGPPERRRITTACVCNGRYFGAGMRIAPQASLVDGRLDVILIDRLSLLEVIAHSPRLYAGTHLALPQVHQARARSVAAHPHPPEVLIRLEVDGESPGVLPAEFVVCPQALRLRVPA
jgi:diacylglycerol kinase (ATP)